MIEKFGVYKFDSDWQTHSRIIERVINECTEKEFPEFDMETKGDCGNVVGTLHVYHDGGSVWIEEDVQGQLSLLPDEFECFTEACNKIVEWFKEQK